MVELKFNIKDEISPRMAQLMDSLKDFTEPLKKSEEYMLGSIAETFRVGGRPEKWAPLKPSSIRARAYRHRRGSSARAKRARKKAIEVMMAGNIRPLIDTGTLMRSVTARTPTAGSIRKLTKTELVIGTNVEYAPYHQYGTKYIPARPFLQILPEDKENITQIFKDWLEKVAGYKGG
jgi:phage gpG-like protein